VLERVGEPRGHLAVASSGVDEDPARREPRDEALEPGARRRLLVGVVQEHLERSLVVAAQRAVELDHLHRGAITITSAPGTPPRSAVLARAPRSGWRRDRSGRRG